MDPRFISFHGVENEYLRDCFREAHSRFPELHGNSVCLHQLPLVNYTMRAQPIIDWRIIRRSWRTYRVQMSNHVRIAEHVQPAELPREVLVGWFAHELGHVVDYHRRNLFGLLWFIIGYVLFTAQRMGAERRADLFALDQGFGEELMATKTYLLDHATLPDSYKDRLRKYYMSPDELELLLLDNEDDRVLF